MVSVVGDLIRGVVRGLRLEVPLWDAVMSSFAWYSALPRIGRSELFLWLVLPIGLMLVLMAMWERTERWVMGLLGFVLWLWLVFTVIRVLHEAMRLVPDGY